MFRIVSSSLSRMRFSRHLVQLEVLQQRSRVEKQHDIFACKFEYYSASWSHIISRLLLNMHDDENTFTTINNVDIWFNCHVTKKEGERRANGYGVGISPRNGPPTTTIVNVAI